MVVVTIHIISAILRTLDIILHTTGIYLLLSRDQYDKSSVQQLYIINLSASEICFSVLWLSYDLPDLIPGHKRVNIIDLIERYRLYIKICIYSSVVFVFYCIMIYITCDRLVATKFALKYRVYWNRKRAKVLVSATWFVAFLLFLVIILVDIFSPFAEYHSIDVQFHKYFYMPINFIFIVLAVLTYLFIFRVYKRSVDMKSSRRNSVFVVFYKSHFYISVLLILTFLVFIIIPDLVYLCVISLSNQDPEKFYQVVLSACVVSYSIANIMNGCLYIFCQPNIRERLWKLCQRKRTNCSVAKGASSVFWIIGSDERNLQYPTTGTTTVCDNKNEFEKHKNSFVV